MAKRLEGSFNHWLNGQQGVKALRPKMPCDPDSLVLSGFWDIIPEEIRGSIADRILKTNSDEDAVFAAMSTVLNCWHTGMIESFPDITVEYRGMFYGVETKQSRTREGTVSANDAPSGWSKKHCETMLAVLVREDKPALVAYGYATVGQKTVRIAHWEHWIP